MQNLVNRLDETQFQSDSKHRLSKELIKELVWWPYDGAGAVILKIYALIFLVTVYSLVFKFLN